MNDLTIGIIGGMGPEATANFYFNLIRATQVNRDQDHFHVIIDSNAKIPDRTKSILEGGENPVPYIIKSAENLKLIGAEIGCIPCITSHYYFYEIQKGTSLKLLNALELLNNSLLADFQGKLKIGVLATSGTVKTKLFNKYLDQFEVIYPENNSQEKFVMKAIYGEKGIKNGHLIGLPAALLINAVTELQDQGAQVIIAGCTEVSLALKQDMIDLPLLDPMNLVIQKLISIK